ncbi:MAG: transcriptional repressor LexA [Anaerolineae bacterium]
MNPFEGLSDKQKRILNVISDWTQKHGYPPTIRDIGNAVGISSTSVVNYNLNKLRERGLVIREEKVSRGIRLSKPAQELMVHLTDEPRDLLRVPNLGNIAAGQPLPIPGDDLAYPSDEDMVSIPSALLGSTDPKDVYALKVQGYSMIDAMINEGDTVILKRTDVARNGEMVAVWLPENNETTLKKYYDEGDMVRLQPANPYMDAIRLPKHKVQIQGRVLAVLRRVN